MTWRSLVPASVEALLRSVDRYMRQVAIEIGNGNSFNKAQVGVYFGNPGVEKEDPYFGGVAKTRDYVFTEYGQR